MRNELELAMEFTFMVTCIASMIALWSIVAILAP